ncbi:MAG: hypothetical protein ACPG4T_13600, partial [Nannocystaceae bacterium]
LHEYAERPLVTPEETLQWELPFQAKRIVVGLMIAAAKDDPSQLERVMAPDARWGPPDRREIGSKLVFDAENGSKEFFEVLRAVAARFPGKTVFNCPPMPNAAQYYVRNGSEPMWCFYMNRSSPQADVLAVRMAINSGKPKIDFIGMFPTPPTQADLMRLRTIREPSPPLNPRMERQGNGMAPPRIPGQPPGAIRLPGQPGGQPGQLPPGVRVIPGNKGGQPTGLPPGVRVIPGNGQPGGLPPGVKVIPGNGQPGGLPPGVKVIPGKKPN